MKHMYTQPYLNNSYTTGVELYKFRVVLIEKNLIGLYAENYRQVIGRG